jgi:hypothetical protein
MKISNGIVALIASLSFAAFSFAQVPSDAPAGSTGQCRDGSYSSAASKRGACSGHKGVQTWYATDSGSAASAAAPAVAPAAVTAAPAPARPPVTAAPVAPAAPAAPAPGKSTSAFVPPANAAPGGGPGLVWLNSGTNVYHCPADRWYGKTKNGEYLTEAAAKAKGARPDHGKVCQ